MGDETLGVAPGDDVEPAAARRATAELMYGVPMSHSCGQTVLHPSRDDYLRVAQALHADGFAVCVDVTAADYLVHPGRSGLPADVVAERFEVVVSLLDLVERRRIRMRAQVPADDAVLPSLFELYPSTEAAEREVFDMFGIVFDAHPDLTRILMPEDWIGHPLRKDHNSGRIPVQFKNPVSAPDEPGSRDVGFPARAGGTAGWIAP